MEPTYILICCRICHKQHLYILNMLLCRNWMCVLLIITSSDWVLPQLQNRKKCDLFAFLLLLLLGGVLIVTSLLGGVLIVTSLLGGVLCNYTLIYHLFHNIFNKLHNRFPYVTWLHNNPFQF